MHAPLETELKLECDLSDLGTFRSHPRLEAASTKKTETLRSVYFDTPDLELRDAGLTLRVRTVDGRHVQTVKALGDGLLNRPEWERPVASAQPDPAATAETPVAKLVGADAKLEPVFVVMVERGSFLIEQGGSTIEVALDEGRIATRDDAPSASVSICEIELELKSGEAADLFALAKELSAAAPLRVGLRSKSERGYALLSGETAGVVKAAPIALHSEMAAAQAFQAIAHNCLKHMRGNEATLLDHRDDEALHQMRVAIRRLRSAASLFADLLEDEKSAGLLENLKRMTEPLGVARNLDVFLAKTLPQERERRPDQGGLLNLEKQLESERTEAYAAVGELITSDAWLSRVLDLVTWINVGPWLAPDDKSAAMALAQPARSFATEALEKRRRQVKKRGRKLDKISDEKRHEARIAAKKLRYGAEFFGALYPGAKAEKRRAAFVTALKRLQGRLGELNDIATGQALVAGAAEERLEGRSSLFAAGVTSADLDAGSAGLLKAARAAYDELIDQRPFWR